MRTSNHPIGLYACYPCKSVRIHRVMDGMEACVCGHLMRKERRRDGHQRREGDINGPSTRMRCDDLDRQFAVIEFVNLKRSIFGRCDVEEYSIKEQGECYVFWRRRRREKRDSGGSSVCVDLNLRMIANLRLGHVPLSLCNSHHRPVSLMTSCSRRGTSGR